MSSTEKVNISINDIANCLNIIDVVSQRGAIKGPELTSVGQLRDKFALFIEQNKPPEENSPKEEASGSGTK